MFSRKTLKMLLAFNFSFFFLLLSVSCSNNHNFVEPETLVSLSFDANCLDRIESDFELYKQELLSDTALAQDFNCLREALDYVKIRAKGSRSDFYTVLEMERFLNKLLFKDSAKSLVFFSSLVDVKALIFGGEPSGLSFKDFDKLKDFLTSTEKMALALKDQASELFFQEAFVSADEAEESLRVLIPFVSEWLKFANKDLKIESFVTFLEEAEFEIKSKNNWVALFNLIREAKAGDQVVLNQDKEKLVGTLQKYYLSALNLYRVLEADWEYNRDDFFNLSVEVDKVLVNLQDTIKGQEDSNWSRSDLLYILNLISDYEVLSEPISSEVREHVVDVVFGKWFSAENEKQTSLSEINFQKIILSWNEIKSFVVESREVEGFKGKGFPFVKQGSDAFALFTQQRWPSLVRENRTLYIPDFEPEVEFSFQSLFHVSWQFAVAKILVEAYTLDSIRHMSQTGLTLDEVKTAYLDVFVLLKEIGFLNEDSRGGWFRIFNEGNLFVPSAEPDEFVSLSEVADYAAYMFSAVFMANTLEDKIAEVCPNFVEKCSFDFVRKQPKKAFEPLPGLINYFGPSLKKGSYRRWQRGFEFIAKSDNNDEAYESSHWFRGTVANQYNEVIYRKYDLDSSDTLSFEEVSLAYGDFKAALKLLPQVKGTPNENKDDVLKSFLTLFVKKGRLPKLRNGRPSGELIRHVQLCGSVQTSENKECRFESDRSKILSLLAYLSSL